MLIEFSVENFRSIRTRQTLSMVAAKGNELRETHVFKPESFDAPDLLRSAAVYGPNASGKTNLIKALEAMQKIVTSSASELQRGDELPVTPYLFAQATQSAPSTFEVIFIAEGVRYQYGFSATRERIHDEWLFAYPKGRIQRWYQRAYDPDKKEYVWEMGGKLQGAKQLWRESTRENALFLSTAITLNSEQLKPVFDWFSFTLKIMTSMSSGIYFTTSVCAFESFSNGQKEKTRRIIDLLRIADFDIEDFIIESKSPLSVNSPENISESLRSAQPKEIPDNVDFNFKMIHRSEEGQLVPLVAFEDESKGTIKFFSLAGPTLASLDLGNVLCIDELNDNLHPLLVEFLIKRFNDPKTNPSNAQLLFTTHETSILNQDTFRRDQIWFCDKSKGQATTLYPLSDFTPRKKLENLEKSYLSGRYGALPYFRKVSADMEG